MIERSAMLWVWLARHYEAEKKRLWGKVGNTCVLQETEMTHLRRVNMGHLSWWRCSVGITEEGIYSETPICLFRCFWLIGKQLWQGSFSLKAEFIYKTLSFTILKLDLGESGEKGDCQLGGIKEPLSWWAVLLICLAKILINLFYQVTFPPLQVLRKAVWWIRRKVAPGRKGNSHSQCSERLAVWAGTSVFRLDQSSDQSEGIKGKVNRLERDLG